MVILPLTKSVSWIPTVCKDAVSAFCKKELVFVETTYDALSAWIICKSLPLANELVCEFTTKLPVSLSTT